MANLVYNLAKGNLGDGSIDWTTTAIKVALVSDVYVEDPDHTNFTTHVVANEISGVNYDAGGVLITTPAVVVDNTADHAEYTCDNITWAASTITAAAAVVYASVSGDLIAYVDFGADKSSSNGDFTITWHADGVFKLA